MPQFPARTRDGSFAVDVKLSHKGTGDAASRVERWVREWIAANGTWRRELPAAEGPFEDVRTYDEEFSACPTVGVAGGMLVLRFHGTGHSSFWKDWVSRIANEVSEAFPDVGDLVGIEDRTGEE